jgi:HK97 family phage portal protein
MKLSFPFIKTSRNRPKGKVTSLSERREVVADAYRNPPNMKAARPWIEFVSDFKLTKLRDYDSYQLAGTSKLWASFHAIDTIAKAIISTQFKVTKKDKEIEDENHPLLKLLVEPNPLDSWEELIYVWPFHIKFTGNAYWLKDEINGKGQPSAVYPLLPQFIEVVPDRIKRIGKFIYRVNGRTIEIEPEEMIHFRNPHPNNVIFGLGDMEAGEMMFEDYINRNSLESNYLSKGGVPSGVLTRKDEVEDPEEWKKFTKKWKEEYERLDNTGKTAFLNGDWSYVKMGLSPTELQTMQRSEMTVKNIFTLHGVPLSVAGVEAATNYATAKQDSIHFKRWTIMPLLDMFCSKLNSGKVLTRNYDPALKLAYELGGMTDVGGIVTEYGPLVDKGAMTRNELRKLCELEEVKDKPMMDEFLINQGLVPIDMAGMGGGMGDEETDSLIGGVPPNQEPDDPELPHRFKDDSRQPKPVKDQPVDDNLKQTES